MNQEEYENWVSSQDRYPEHLHMWIVKLYHKILGENQETFYRQYGPFCDKIAAKEFSKTYRSKFTEQGFISSAKIEPLCVPAS